MLSVLVAHSYFLRFDQKQLRRAKPYPPLATLQVANLLRQAGHRVTFFDAMLADSVEEYATPLHANAPQLALFYEDNYNYLSKMCLGRMRDASIMMVAQAKRRGARVIVAGSDASDSPRDYLQAGAEVVLSGEGLSALHKLVSRLDQDPGMSTLDWVEGIDNIAIRTLDGHIARRVFSPDIVQQPCQAAWDLIDVERYREIWLRAHGHFSLNMAASRGCSFRCNWCAKPIWGNRYLQRSAQSVAEEMLFLKRELSVDHIWFTDDIFGFRVDWIEELAGILAANGVTLPFTIQTRADLISEAMASALRKAGCYEAWLGAESGSQRILDRMNKGTTVEETLIATRRLRQRGVRVAFFIQLGYLGEELEDILATRALIESAEPDDIGVSVSYPLPGTKFYEMVKEQLGPKTHWDDSSDLAMMFQGTFTSEFYRTVRDLLHEHVALRNGAEADLTRRKDELEKRWSHLTAEEQRFRTPPSAPALISAAL